MIATPKFNTVVIVNFPNVDPDTYAFDFNTSAPFGAFAFTFKWLNSRWQGWATLPSGEVRPFGCVPYVTNWTGFPDYGLVIASNLASLGINDLINSTLYLVEWQQ